VSTAVASVGSERTAYVGPTRYLDSDHPDVMAFAHDSAGSHRGDRDRAVALYYAVRDGIRYDPYRIQLTAEAMRASAVLERGSGFCVAKAVLLAAGARALGVPSRLGFADVRNHLTTPRLRRIVKTDVFKFHGYTDLHLDGQWVKATPAFNASLCERFDVDPLAFDGKHDALLQQADRQGNRYMEYLTDRGTFADLPLDEIRQVFEDSYPSVFANEGIDASVTFEDDASRQGGSS
jgi:transglutaminase-like putative cysteine protease